MTNNTINMQVVLDSVAQTVIRIRIYKKTTKRFLIISDIRSWSQHIFFQIEQQDSINPYCCKDKKGEDVYAGDIVLRNDGETRAVVYYDHNALRFCLTPWWYGDAEDGFHPHEIEKIGNIYENMDLINI